MAPLNDPQPPEPENQVNFSQTLRDELKALRREADGGETAFEAARRARLSGLAFSGGGIRSATFNLGVLQGLARLNLLPKFDYLSSVSGGGYIGGWLTAWIRREYQALEGMQKPSPEKTCARPAPTESPTPDVERPAGAKGSTAGRMNEFLHRLPDYKDYLIGQLLGRKETRDHVAPVSGEQSTQAGLNKVTGSLDPCRQGSPKETAEAKPISYLRKFSNYLTPRRGWWSADTWTLAVAYVRNFALTFSVLLSALIAVVFLVHGTTVLYSMLLNPSAIIGWTLFAVFAASTFMTSFAISWNLTTCCADANAHDQKVQLSMKMTYVAIGACMLAIWCGAAGLWHIHEGFFDRFFSDVTIIAIAITLAAVNAGLSIGGKKARAFLNRVVPATGSPEPARKRRPLIIQVLAGLASCASLILAISLLEYWMGKWPAGPNWLGKGHWLAVVWGPLLTVLAINIFVTAFVGAAGDHLEELEREWLARLLAPVTKWTGLFCLLSALVLYAPIAVQWLGRRLHGLPDGILGILWAGISAAGAFLARNRDKNGVERSEKWMVRAVMTIAPVVFMVGLVVITVWGLNKWWPTYLNTSDAETVYWKVLPKVTGTALVVSTLAGLVVFLLTWLWSTRIGVNTFSLHALYGDRLIRAYLGASNLTRRAHPFIGFDPRDNEIRLWHLNPGCKGYRGPFLIVNAAINLVHSARLAWQQRKAGSFTFTPLYCGYEFSSESIAEKESAPAPRGGYVRSERYAGGQGISLGKAVTISGAAASPNMGYHSSAALSILMTVFNVRLGWWLPNTGLGKPDLWPRKGPPSGLFYLWREFFGLTNARGDYVYVSDGGHFENLGIYELVRRQVRFIVACDAAADPKRKFGDLGNAIERCRADFGISIDIDVSQLIPHPATRFSRWHCAVGKIRYNPVDPMQDGILLYIKASLTGDEPRDVAAYAAQQPDFPHESTVDQWFNESQFESYRALGFHTILSVMETAVKVANEEKEELSVFRRPAEAGAETYPAELVRIFRELQKKWHPGKEPDTGKQVDHDAILAEILHQLRTDPLLAFLDWQLYPDLAATVRGKRLSPRTKPSVPRGYAELRAGFYFCKRLLQFMQQVCHGRELDTAHDAPGNRGWMNLMRRWSFSCMLRYTYSMTVGTYSARFQTFCKHQLGLEIGRLIWGAPPLIIENEQPQVPENIAGKDKWQAAANRYGFDFFEKLIVEAFPRLYATNNAALEKGSRFKIYPLEIITEDPAASDPDKFARITVGFAIVGPQRHDGLLRDRVLYIRIHPTMRRLGLFRQALEKIPQDETKGSVYPVASSINLDLAALEQQPNRSWRHRIYRELYALKRNCARFAWREGQSRQSVADEPSAGETSGTASAVSSENRSQ